MGLTCFDLCTLKEVTYFTIFFNHVIGSITVAASLSGVTFVIAGGLITPLFK